MPRFHRIHDLLAILHGRRYAISLRELTEELECSKATVKRHINALRFEYSAPIRYDKKYGGYVLDKSDEDSLQLPGIWFNISELHSLLLIQELLDQLEPGLLKVDLNPFRQRIESILSNRNIQSSDLRKRIQFIGVGVRICCPLQFKMVVRATMERKRISINYHSRTTNRLSKRTVSPQRLLYYRGNWYLVAYCHTRKEIRTLALDRIKETHPLKEPCSELEESELKRHFGQSYGIFSGEAEETAILRFTKERARWVAEEQWHPHQRSRWLDDGGFELSIPYSDARELILEILRYGSDVEVLSPPSLREEIAQRLVAAAEKYKN